MRAIGIVYMIVGIVAVLGALVAAYVLITLGEMVSLINGANPANLPPGTDVTALQASVGPLGVLISAGWVWIICVLLSGVFSFYLGIKTIRTKTSIKR